MRVLDTELRDGKWLVSALGMGTARCPECDAHSSRRHGWRIRHLQDLPVQGAHVTLRVKVTRWRCLNPRCFRQTFADPLPGVAAPLGRQPRRVAELARLVGHTTGGRPAECLLNRLGLPQSDDTVLRNLKRHAGSSSQNGIRVVGVDDWAWQKGCRYGTIMVDLERREVVDVLPDRSARTTGEWLAQHPGIVSSAAIGAASTPKVRVRARRRPGRWPTASICCRTCVRRSSSNSAALLDPQGRRRRRMPMRGP